MGTGRGNVILIKPYADDFANSTVDILAVHNSTISALQVDYRRGYLYAATDALNRDAPSFLFKISLTSFSVVESIELGPLNYDVRGSAIVDTESGKQVVYR